jgi:indolepyruvate ferredoxin oxidoreductase
VLVYDQTCAAEKRRRRKRGTFPDPAVRVFINEAVCEGCGDCSAKSNCLAVVPVETEFGRKRAIDQSPATRTTPASTASARASSRCTAAACGAARRWPARSGIRRLPEPRRLPAWTEPYGILVAGVGGTGVVTIGALIGMAAHLEGKGVTVLDMTGLAQKGGAVMSHVRIARKPGAAACGAHRHRRGRLLLGCDIVVAVSDDALSKTAAGRTRAIVNTGAAITGDFLRNPDRFPARCHGTVMATPSAPEAPTSRRQPPRHALLMGHHRHQHLHARLRLPEAAACRSPPKRCCAPSNSTAPPSKDNRAPSSGAAAPPTTRPPSKPWSPPASRRCRRTLSTSLDEIIARRREFLDGLQDEAYARRYMAAGDRVRVRESAPHRDACSRPATALIEAVARNYFKLLAYKDEYEVARLFADPSSSKCAGRQLRRRLPARLPHHPALVSRRQRNPAPSRRKSASAPGCCRQ